ncbi:hypothetical protein PEPS_44800 (plasmid) [Persicobacter psychrovividus]|uniref:Uncharacterized protein n=1 Tax=Persicobacter psychrovividus TaxID=387638 RepID=A0ABM7VMJ1_9BACT|nr:hypothetical protein PEPS_44800 [Persicobacter psychrovividus]
MKVIEVNNFKTRNRPVRIRMQGGVGGVLVKEEIFFHQPSTRLPLRNRGDGINFSYNYLIIVIG